MNSIEAVKKKIKVLQEQAEEAEERAERLQKEVEKEKRSREEVQVEEGRLCGSVGSFMVPLWFCVFVHLVVSDAMNTCICRRKNVWYFVGESRHSQVKCSTV